jgi:hypothetical protein
MKNGFLMSLGVVLFGLPVTAARPAHIARHDCVGADCLVVDRVQVGTRCGKSTSIEVDIHNDSHTQYLRGYVVFQTNAGKRYEPTGLLKPGEKLRGVIYTCEASSQSGVLANTGADPVSLSYPRHP